MKSFFNVGLSAALLLPHLAPVGHHSPPVWFPWHRERTEQGMSLLTRLQVHPSVHTHTNTHTHRYIGNEDLSHTQSTFPQSCNKSGVSALLPISHYTHNPYRAAAAINPNQLHGSNFCCCHKTFCLAELYESSKNLKLVHAKAKRPCYCVCCLCVAACRGLLHSHHRHLPWWL